MNTEICEQLFVGINQHKNCKSMNESNFFLFWLYNLEIHNLDLEGMANTEPNPHTEFRWTKFEIKPVNISYVPEKHSVEEITDDLGSAQISDIILFKCKECPAGYRSMGQLTKHINTKHANNMGKPMCPIICENGPCGKTLSTVKALEKHITTVHKTCSVCKMSVDSEEERVEHMKQHTFCKECNKDFKFESKLKRHLIQKH